MCPLAFSASSLCPCVSNKTAVASIMNTLIQSTATAVAARQVPTYPKKCVPVRRTKPHRLDTSQWVLYSELCHVRRRCWSTSNSTHSTMEVLMKVAKTCACSDGRPEPNFDDDKGDSFTSTSAHTTRRGGVVGSLHTAAVPPITIRYLPRRYIDYTHALITTAEFPLCSFLIAFLTKHSTHWCALVGLTHLKRDPGEDFRGSYAHQTRCLRAFRRQHTNVHRDRSHGSQFPPIRPDPVLNESSVEVFRVESLKRLNLHAVGSGG